jgi:hypothetical protein
MSGVAGIPALVERLAVHVRELGKQPGVNIQRMVAVVGRFQLACVV